MCILREQVVSVGGTKIFVTPSQDATRQLTVYENTVNTAGPNMMILPIPYPETFAFEEGVMEYRDLFRHAAESLYIQRPEAFTRCAAAPAVAPPLKVHSVGPYLASIALSILDLDRLDSTVFSPLATNLREMLLETYVDARTPFGFLCCRLRPGDVTYAPIAYSHATLPAGLFVPTKHYHGHVEAFADDWDHLVYSFGTEEGYVHSLSEGNTHYIPVSPNKIAWPRLPPPFRRSPDEPIRCWRKTGVYRNVDLVLPLEGGHEGAEDPVQSASSSYKESYFTSLPSLWGAFH